MYNKIFFRNLIKSSIFYLIFLIPIFLGLHACNNSSEKFDNLKMNNLDTSDYETINIPDSMTFDFNKLIDSNSLEIIPLKMTDSSHFIEASRIFVVDSTIVIFDKIMESVILFNKKGSFINRIDTDKLIARIFKIAVDPLEKQIYIYDEKLKNILRYDLSGNLIDIIGKNYFFNSFNPIPNSSNFAYLVLQDDNDRFSEIFSKSQVFIGNVHSLNSYVDQLKKDSLLTGNFLPEETLFSSSDYLYFSPPFSYSVYEIAEQTKLKYKLKFPGTSIKEVAKGKNTRQFVDLLNSKKYYHFDGITYRAQNKIYFEIRKDELIGYFYDLKTKEISGGRIVSVLKNGEKAVLPNFSYPVASNGSKFVSLISPPHLIFSNFIEKTKSKIDSKSKDMPLIILYNVL